MNISKLSAVNITTHSRFIEGLGSTLPEGVNQATTDLQEDKINQLVKLLVYYISVEHHPNKAEIPIKDFFI